MTSVEAHVPEAEVAPERETLSGLVRGYFDRLRGGEVGMLPVLIGLALITLYFWSKNHNFIKPVNLDNLVVQMAGVSIIAMLLLWIFYAPATVATVYDVVRGVSPPQVIPLLPPALLICCTAATAQAIWRHAHPPVGKAAGRGFEVQ